MSDCRSLFQRGSEGSPAVGRACKSEAFETSEFEGAAVEHETVARGQPFGVLGQQGAETWPPQTTRTFSSELMVPTLERSQRITRQDRGRRRGPWLSRCEGRSSVG